MDSTLTLLDYFLFVYFYQIENKLNSSENELVQVKFQSEEANTDEGLKRFFKELLSKNNSIEHTDIEQLSINIDSKIQCVNIEELSNYKITKVLLPEELTPIQKKIITDSKKSVYTNPDLYLEISDSTNIFYKSVELKSTKDDNIPGSSVQQVSPFEWVIFVKRNKDSVLVTTGHYINSITEKLPFPDRSPRPQVGFKTLQKWNEQYRKTENKILSIAITTETHNDKKKLLKDWQDYLAMEWLEIIKAKTVKKKEKWFNNALRKFAIKFLDYSDNLSADEKTKLKETLTELTKEADKLPLDYTTKVNE